MDATRALLHHSLDISATVCITCKKTKPEKSIGTFSTYNRLPAKASSIENFGWFLKNFKKIFAKIFKFFLQKNKKNFLQNFLKNFQKTTKN